MPPLDYFSAANKRIRATQFYKVGKIEEKLVSLSARHILQ